MIKFGKHTFLKSIKTATKMETKTIKSDMATFKTLIITDSLSIPNTIATTNGLFTNITSSIPGTQIMRVTVSKASLFISSDVITVTGFYALT